MPASWYSAEAGIAAPEKKCPTTKTAPSLTSFLRGGDRLLGVAESHPPVVSCNLLAHRPPSWR